jgi:hypothetical protein
VEPAEAIKNMICRQRDLVKERSNQVAKYKLQVLSVGRSLTNQQDKLALNWLCMEGYKLWENTSKWPQYKIATSSINPDERLVSHPDSDKAPYVICVTCVEGTTCISEMGRCNCTERTAYLHQCKHERAVLKGRFVNQLWQKRWSQRRSIVMSNGNPPAIDNGAAAGSNTGADGRGLAGVHGQPKQPEDESIVLHEDDDDDSTLVEETVDFAAESNANGSLGQHPMEPAFKTTKLNHRQKMDIIHDLATAYEGHKDEMEFYGAMIAQTLQLKGKGDPTVGSSEFLANYLSGFTSCRSNEVLFSQMEHSQTASNDAPLTVALAPSLVPFGCKPSSNTGAPQRNRLKSIREQRCLMNSKKLKQACRFCWLPGHNAKQCDLLKNYAGNATEITVHKKMDFAWSLVTANKLYQVERSNDETNWQEGCLPADAYHVVVLAMLEGSNVVGGTGLLVNLWSMEAKPCVGHMGPTVYRSQAVSQWILTKGQAKPKRLFSSLQPCPSVNQMEKILIAEI